MNAPGLSPLMCSEPGSFARHTITHRKPQIIQGVIQDNNYPAGIVEMLWLFQREIAELAVRPLQEELADVPFWNNEISYYKGKTWLELPWYLAETFFYRRLLEAVTYFQPGPWQGHDPFGMQKEGQEKAAVEWLAVNWGRLEGMEPETTLELLLHASLWGNRFDLSNLGVSEQASSGWMGREEQEHILINHSRPACSRLAAGLTELHFINDNAGRELLLDMVLADLILNHRWAEKVVFHLKDRPFFVSDAMPKDLQKTLILLGQSSASETRELAKRLDGYQRSERLELRDDPFWSSCLMLRQMPAELDAELGRADLVILKGDVNYRRLLDDAHWPHTARMEEIAVYFPAPFLVLRTLKGEIMVGLEPGQAEELAARDPDWLINGKRGIIQLVD